MVLWVYFVDIHEEVWVKIRPIRLVFRNVRQQLPYKFFAEGLAVRGYVMLVILVRHEVVYQCLSVDGLRARLDLVPLYFGVDRLRKGL